MELGVVRKLDPKRKSNEVSDLERGLRKRVVGQDDAITKVVDTFQMFTAGLNPPNRPVANLLFLGPTGSGKTRVVESLAECLYGDPRACIKIDCSEFQHSHEIAKLIGSPPGYLGHRETHPLLTQEALNQWHTEKVQISILLFDEIEKASDALWKLLLGIMDKATLTLGDNRRVDLSQCVIIMTSNLGASQMTEMVDGGLGFAGAAPNDTQLDDRLTSTAVGAAKRKFTPEFMNRIDKTVVFKSLKDEDLRKILDIELGLLQDRITMSTKSCHFDFVCTPRLKDYILKEGTDRKYGARHLKRAIEKSVVMPIASLVSTGQIGYNDIIRIDLSDSGDVLFEKTTEGTSLSASSRDRLIDAISRLPIARFQHSDAEEEILSDLASKTRSYRS